MKTDKTEKCPYCENDTYADFVDVGVGMIQCGPFHCENCKSYQIGPHDDHKDLTEIEEKTGWYEPLTDKKYSSGNVKNNEFISHEEARKDYRESFGVFD